LFCSGVKLKHDPQSYKWKNYYGKKGQTVNASDGKWVECEHIKQTGTILHLETQIHQLKCKMDSLMKPKVTDDAHQVQSNLDKLKMKLSTEMKIVNSNLSLNHS
jgi:hypothetical protein